MANLPENNLYGSATPSPAGNFSSLLKTINKGASSSAAQTFRTNLAQFHAKTPPPVAGDPTRAEGYTPPRAGAALAAPTIDQNWTPPQQGSFIRNVPSSVGEGQYVVNPNTGERAKVLRVLDGDTIGVDFGDGKETIVRYQGINTPEIPHSPEEEALKPQSFWEPGYKAADINAGMLPIGSEVRLESDKTAQDKYGRELRYVWGGDKSLTGQSLMQQGQAAPMQFPADIKYPGRNINKRVLSKAELDILKKRGLPPSLFTVDYIVPLWADGQDTLANRQILSNKDYAKKMAVQSVPLTLFVNGQLGGTIEQQRAKARQMALAWKKRDASGLPSIDELNQSGGYIPLDVAKKYVKKWEEDEIPSMWSLFKSSIAENVRGFGSPRMLGNIKETLGLGTPGVNTQSLSARAPLIGEFGKGMVGGFTAGAVPGTFPEEDATFAEKTFNFAGNIVGMIGGFGLVGKGLARIGAFGKTAKAVTPPLLSYTGTGIKALDKIAGTLGKVGPGFLGKSAYTADQLARGAKYLELTGKALGDVRGIDVAKAAAGRWGGVGTGIWQSGLTMAVFGQLGLLAREMTDQEKFEYTKNLKQAATDTVFGGILGAAGMWGAPAQSLRGYVHVGGGTTMWSLMNGATIEDAVKEGITMTALHGLGYERGAVDPKKNLVQDAVYTQGRAVMYEDFPGIFDIRGPIPEVYEMTPKQINAVQHLAARERKRFSTPNATQLPIKINTTSDALIFLKELKKMRTFEMQAKNPEGISMEDLEKEYRRIEVAATTLLNRTLPPGPIREAKLAADVHTTAEVFKPVLSRAQYGQEINYERVLEEINGEEANRIFADGQQNNRSLFSGKTTNVGATNSISPVEQAVAAEFTTGKDANGNPVSYEPYVIGVTSKDSAAFYRRLQVEQLVNPELVQPSGVEKNAQKYPLGPRIEDPNKTVRLFVRQNVLDADGNPTGQTIDKPIGFLPQPEKITGRQGVNASPEKVNERYQNIQNAFAADPVELQKAINKDRSMAGAQITLEQAQEISREILKNGNYSYDDFANKIGALDAPTTYTVNAHTISDIMRENNSNYIILVPSKKWVPEGREVKGMARERRKQAEAYVEFDGGFIPGRVKPGLAKAPKTSDSTGVTKAIHDYTSFISGEKPAQETARVGGAAQEKLRVPQKPLPKPLPKSIPKPQPESLIEPQPELLPESEKTIINAQETVAEKTPEKASERPQDEAKEEYVEPDALTEAIEPEVDKTAPEPDAGIKLDINISPENERRGANTEFNENPLLGFQAALNDYAPPHWSDVLQSAQGVNNAARKAVINASRSLDLNNPVELETKRKYEEWEKGFTNDHVTELAETALEKGGNNQEAGLREFMERIRDEFIGQGLEDPTRNIDGGKENEQAWTKVFQDAIKNRKYQEFSPDKNGRLVASFSDTKKSKSFLEEVTGMDTIYFKQDFTLSQKAKKVVTEEAKLNFLINNDFVPYYYDNSPDSLMGIKYDRRFSNGKSLTELSAEERDLAMGRFTTDIVKKLGFDVNKDSINSFIKRLKSLNSKEQVVSVQDAEGNPIMFKHYVIPSKYSPKIKDTTSDWDNIKINNDIADIYDEQGNLVKSADDIKKEFGEKTSINGGQMMHPKMIKLIAKTHGYIYPNRLDHLKTTQSYNHPMTNALWHQKHATFGWTPEDVKFYEDLLGVKLDKNSIITFEDNIKVGFGNKDFGELVTRQRGDGVEPIEYWVVDIPSTSYRVKYNGPHTFGGAVSPGSILSKAHGETIAKAVAEGYLPQANNIRTLIEEINNTSGTIDEIREIWKKHPEFGGEMWMDNLYGVLEKASKNGAGLSLVGPTLNKKLNSFIMSYTKGEHFDGDNLVMRPEFSPMKLDKDGKRVYMSSGEAMMNKRTFLGKYGGKELPEVREKLLFRYPTLKPTSISKGKVLIAEEHKIELEDGAVIMNAADTMKYDHDYDIDALQSFTVGGKHGVPVELAEYFVEKAANGEMPFADLQKSDKVPMKNPLDPNDEAWIYKKMREMNNENNNGAEAIGIAAASVRPGYFLAENNFVAKFESPLDNRRVVTFWLNGQQVGKPVFVPTAIRVGKETVQQFSHNKPFRVSVQFGDKQSYIGGNIGQEAVDSVGTKDLNIRLKETNGNSSAYMLEMMFPEAKDPGAKSAISDFVQQFQVPFQIKNSLNSKYPNAMGSLQPYIDMLKELEPKGVKMGPVERMILNLDGIKLIDTHFGSEAKDRQIERDDAAVASVREKFPETEPSQLVREFSQRLIPIRNIDAPLSEKKIKAQEAWNEFKSERKITPQELQEIYVWLATAKYGKLDKTYPIRAVSIFSETENPVAKAYFAGENAWQLKYNKEQQTKKELGVEIARDEEGAPILDEHGRPIEVSAQGVTIKAEDIQVEGKKNIVAARNKRTHEILLNPHELDRQWEKKSWAFRGNKAWKPLPEDIFKTKEEFIEFNLQHELAHEKNPEMLEGETSFDYETRMNNEALKAMGKSLPEDTPPEPPTEGGAPAPKPEAPKPVTPAGGGTPTQPSAPRVKKIISGAQSGADIAGLDAAMELGIPTGGTAAAGHMRFTDAGVKVSQPEITKKYGLVEGEWSDQVGQYGPYKNPWHKRTVKNASESDGTLWIGNDSRGKTLTINSAKRAGKPVLENPKNAEELRRWLADNNIETLNVAGNREHTNVGIYEKTKKILKDALGEPNEVAKMTDFQKKAWYNKMVSEGRREEAIGKLFQRVDTPKTTESKTSAHVKVVDGVQGVRAAELAGEGINTLRKSGNEHFGNPFQVPGTTLYPGNVRAVNVEAAVQAYRKWLNGSAHTNVKPEQRKWILEQIDSGKLDGKTLLYYKKLNEPSHADALADFVNERRGLPQKQAEVTQPTLFKEEAAPAQHVANVVKQGKTFEDRMRDGESFELSEFKKEFIDKIPNRNNLPVNRETPIGSIVKYKGQELLFRGVNDAGFVQLSTLSGEKLPGTPSLRLGGVTFVREGESSRVSAAIQKAMDSGKTDGAEPIVEGKNFMEIANEGQRTAITSIHEFITAPFKDGDSTAVLSGAAGTGKTSTLDAILDGFDKAGIKYALAAPTHKAAQQMKKMTRRYAGTIHSLLELKPNYEIEKITKDTLKFARKSEGEMIYSESTGIPRDGVVVIDEASMIHDDLYDIIVEEAARNNTRVLFVGDKYQLKPVGNKNNQYSKAFSSPRNHELTEVMRQASDSPLLKFLYKMRDLVFSQKEDAMHTRTSDLTAQGHGVEFLERSDAGIFNQRIIDAFKDPKFTEDGDSARVLAFSNKRVDEINDLVRSALGFKGDIQAGEYLVANDTVLAGISGIINSGNYWVVKTKPDTKKVLGINLDGQTVTLIDAGIQNPKEEDYARFFLPSDASIEKHGTRLADEVEKPRQIAFKLKMAGDRIGAFPYWKEFFAKNAELQNILTRVDLISSNASGMGGSHVKRASIKPGYASTVHKSQGSTYDQVFVDEINIEGARLKDDKTERWVDAPREDRNALKYVALSRARNKATILTWGASSDVSENAQNEFYASQGPIHFNFDNLGKGGPTPGTGHWGILEKDSKKHDGKGGPIGDMWGGIKEMLSPTKMYYRAKPTPQTQTYNVRGIPVTDKDLDEASKIIGLEISNRPGKDQFEATHIVNTAINRALAGPKQWGSNLVEVLQKPAQYQAYAPLGVLTKSGATTTSRYQQLQQGTLNASEMEKIKRVRGYLDQLKSGDFKDSTDGATFYAHATDGTIWVGKTQAEVKKLVREHERRNKLRKTPWGTATGSPVQD